MHIFLSSILQITSCSPLLLPDNNLSLNTSNLRKNSVKLLAHTYLNSSVIISCLVSCVQRLSLPPRSLCRTSPCSEPLVLIHCTNLSVLLFLSKYSRYSSASTSFSSTDMIKYQKEVLLTRFIFNIYMVQSDISNLGKLFICTNVYQLNIWKKTNLEYSDIQYFYRSTTKQSVHLQMKSCTL